MNITKAMLAIIVLSSSILTLNKGTIYVKIQLITESPGRSIVLKTNVLEFDFDVKEIITAVPIDIKMSTKKKTENMISVVM